MKRTSERPVERILSSVAMMNIPVNDGHPLESTIEGMASGDRNVIEEAEAHSALRALRDDLAGD